MDHFDYRGGELWCEDVPARRIAEDHGAVLTLESTGSGARALLTFPPREKP